MKEGLLTQDEINACYWGDNPTQVAYDAVFWYRFPLLKKAYARSEYREEQGYEKFCMDSWYWLNDYAFYMALKSILIIKNGWPGRKTSASAKKRQWSPTVRS